MACRWDRKVILASIRMHAAKIELQRKRLQELEAYEAGREERRAARGEERPWVICANPPCGRAFQQRNNRARYCCRRCCNSDCVRKMRARERARL